MHLAEQVCENEHDKHILPASLLLHSVSATHTGSSGLLGVSDTLGQSTRGAQGEDACPEGIPAGRMQLGMEASQWKRWRHSFSQHILGNPSCQTFSSPPQRGALQFLLCKASLNKTHGACIVLIKAWPCIEISGTVEGLPRPTAPLAPASLAIIPTHSFPPQPVPGRAKRGQRCGKKQNLFLLSPSRKKQGPIHIKARPLLLHSPTHKLPAQWRTVLSGFPIHTH